MAGTTPRHDGGESVATTAKTSGADPTGKSISILIDAATTKPPDARKSHARKN
jgi:hypothetical protein